jgi:hypothetical protein
MYILGKRVDQLNDDDIKRLVKHQVQETKALDYKRELNLGVDKERKEFLFDITSMYNTEGGCLIFGIEESKDHKGQNTGTPKSITGFTIDNYDKLSQQIEDIIKGNTEPSITNIALNHICVDGQSVLVVGISKGLGLPAMVTFNETNKFYRRRNSGKYAVDVYELNQMFMQNQVLKESAEKFRLNRIDKVRNLKVFPTLDNSASFFIQIIPFSFLNEQTLDFTKANDMGLVLKMIPIYASGCEKMFNLDGFATFSSSSDYQKIDGYDQIFRNGIFETYTSRIFGQKKIGDKIVNNLCGDDFIQETLEKIKNGLFVLNQFQIEPPFLICMSIHNILGGTITGFGSSARQFMTEEVVLPPIIIQTYESDLYDQLKPIFDILWQSVGYSSSPTYRPK